MSYDLYCYRAASGRPDLAEAQSIVEALNAAEEAEETKPTLSDTKERIVAALMAHNPRLERFNFDYGKIAQLQKISEDEARLRHQHVELNPPEGDLAIQIIVHDDNVSISIPYWYQDTDADHVFLQLSAYARVIRETAGFFAYDPQTGLAFDPAQMDEREHQGYDKVMKRLPDILGELKKTNKPWWNFW